MIVLDDLGFADLGCYGSAAATPSIDGLAERGLRYNGFHVTAICSPTRACLMTGRNHHAVGLGFFPDMPMAYPGYTSRIPKSAGTLPRLLRDAGYSTFMVGKWHLTPKYECTAAGPFERWPLGMGFERFYGFLGGSTSQWAPDLACDNGFIELPHSAAEGYHLTEDLASQAIRFVQDQQQAVPEKPFFLYFATGAMHSPHQVPSALIEVYEGRFDDGWEALRERTFRRQLEHGLVPAETTLPERPSWVMAWDDLGPEERRLFARQMEVYAGFLSHTDAQIGRLLGFLAELGVLENTLVMILSDNGASAGGGPHGLLSHDTSDVESMLARIDDLGGVRSSGHYSWGWAWAGNTPFKLWKRYSWLGGVRVPLIVHWPAGVPASAAGQVRAQFCHAIDLMPTILEAASIELPEAVDGVSQQPLDGASMLATFVDADSPSPRSTQYFETVGSRAIYHRDWKATTDHVDDRPVERELIPGSHHFDTDRWSLYRLDDDFAEAHDCAEAEPDRLRQMVELWWSEAGRNQVLPLGDGLFTEERAVEPPPYPAGREYIYRPGAGPIITRPPFVAGFRLTAEFDIAEGHEASGIICAHHDHLISTLPSGWVCFVRDGRVLVVLNTLGFPRQVIAGDAKLAGRHDVEVVYVPDRHGDASISVAVDGEVAATARVPAGPPALAGNEEGRLVIGCDLEIPVCDDYLPPFRFSGEIHRIRYTAFPPTGPGSFRDQVEHALKHD